jgi:hypothetical protein
LRPSFGGIEAHDADGIFILSFEEIAGHRFQVGRSGLRLGPDTAILPEIVQYQIDGLILVFWNDRWRQASRIHSSAKTGLK